MLTTDHRYAEALRVAKEIQDLDGPNVNALCHTCLYTHGERAERSLVLLHGFTNCPQQMDAVGRLFFDRGWNVFIPRYPRHGYADRMTTRIAELRAEHLLAVARRAADVGAGLGERLTVAGLSLGAILAGNLAQEREEIERAVLIAPMLGFKPIPGPLLTAMSVAAMRLPNLYLWWDRGRKATLGPVYGYPRLATHAYAALFECGRRLTSSARRNPPKARAIAVVTNAGEPRVDNRFTYRLVDSWRRQGSTVETFEFPASDHLPHDVVDPGSAAARTGYVYPIVTRMIDGG